MTRFDGSNSRLVGCLGVFFVTLVLLPLQTSAGNYVILAPKIVRPGSEYELSCTILSSVRTTVQLNAQLLDSKNGSIASGQASIAPGSTTTIALQIPSALSEDEYKLSVIGSSGVTVVFSNTTSVSTDQKTLSLFIQTDKATYKPSQKVLFRAIAVYPDLKPYPGQVDVSISDKNGNKIAQWLNQVVSKGVFNGSLQLSEQPPLGTWTIKFVAGTNEMTKTFDVAEYVLPKFSVSVGLPSYYVISSNNMAAQKNLDVTISAQYTYNQPVNGRASIGISFVTYGYENAPTKLMDVELTKGMATVSLTMKDLLPLKPVSPYGRYGDSYTMTTQQQWESLAYRSILVVANVTETVTGIVLSGNRTVQCTSNKYSLSFLSATPGNFKPGVNYTGYLNLSQYDGSQPSPSDVMSNPINVTVTYTYSASTQQSSSSSAKLLPPGGYVPPVTTSTSTSFLLPVTETGVMLFTLSVDQTCSSISVNAAFNDTTSNSTINSYKYLQPFQSRDNQSIQVSLANVNDQISAGRDLSFNVTSTVGITVYYYQLLSKGDIVKVGSMSSPQLSTKFVLSFPVDAVLAQQLAPSARVVVWCITGSGEIISDSLDFVVDFTFANQVTVSLNASTAQPGDGVLVNAKAYKGSYVGLLAIDQSVLLLKTGNDITQDVVLQDLAGYTAGSSHYNPMPILFRKRRRRLACINCGWWRWPIFTGGSDSSAVFENAGLLLMTDTFIYSSPSIFYPMREDGILNMAGAAPGADAGDVAKQNSPASSTGSTSTKPRQNFPETWIWSDLTAGPDGNVYMNATVPDTITSWVLSAFAVSSDVGLGIASSTAKARVTIQKSDQFEVLNPTSNALQSTDAFGDVEVASDDAGSVEFWIVPEALGQVMLSISATSQIAADAVQIPLLVKPEGVPQQYSSSVFVKLSDGQTQSNVFDVQLPPEGLVEGSQYISVTVIGDLLGQALNGLGNLLQMPSGCGEQNMLGFAPDVYVLKYFRASGQTSPKIVSEATNFINIGYQRQLTYRRDDGSYSAFGNSDQSGSVWLSAFVVKCFHEARNVMPVIDDALLAPTMRWILGNQAKNGSFAEPPLGRVIHTDMQGGSAGGISLTAYVLIALLENSDNAELDSVAYRSTVSLALRYLEDWVAKSPTDPYQLNIVCYALTLAGSSQASNALTLLNAAAIDKDGMRHWHKEVSTSSSDDFWRQPYGQAASVDIEMTSYALLTYTKLKDFDNGIKDTVVALQALAEFAALTGGRGSSQQLSISLKTDGSFVFNFDPITPTNSLVLQSVQIPASATKVTVTATGSGVGLVQLNVLYNILAEYAPRSSNVVVVADAQLTGNGQMDISTCASWTAPTPSGMAVMQVGMPSGYAAGDVNQLVDGTVKRVDVDKDNVVLYLDQLSKDKTCVRVPLLKVHPVDDLQPVAVQAFLYYSPDQKSTVTYSPENATSVGTTKTLGNTGRRLSSATAMTVIVAVIASALFAAVRL